MKILIAEDELDMLKIIRMYLIKEGYSVSSASNGQQALDMLYSSTYDLLITDWMMPVLDGITLCREVRASMLPVKIIMLTAKSEVQNEIAGLKCGADDYIRKPFEPQLLLLKIRKLFQLENAVFCGTIVLNPDTHTVHVDGKEIILTIKEWMLLHYLMLQKGTTVSRDRLIDQIWGADYDGDERTLDTHIRRLRRKIGHNYIKTFVGIGYRMDDTNE